MGKVLMAVARERLALPAVRLAPRLLGAVLMSDRNGVQVAIRLTELEAYEGLDDPASHAFRGRTQRNAVMFGPAGHLYVYLSYGMHWCANVVCGPEGRASAVLLRAGEVVRGADTAGQRRPAARSAVDLARGPARLAACLALSRIDDGTDLCAPGSAVQLESMPDRTSGAVRAGPRVGITAAADHPWRFWLDGDPTVSPYRPAARKRVAAARQTGVP
jgi:DNA-3-methyladenine glycosylase